MEISHVRKMVGVAVRVVGLNEEHLLSQRIAEPHKNLWQFPGGPVNPGETIEEAGIREVMEEVGITVKIDKQLLTYIDHEGDFICTLLQSTPYLGILPPNPEPSKATKWTWKTYIPEPRFGGLQMLINRGILRGEP